MTVATNFMEEQDAEDASGDNYLAYTFGVLQFWAQNKPIIVGSTTFLGNVSNAFFETT